MVLGFGKSRRGTAVNSMKEAADLFYAGTELEVAAKMVGVAEEALAQYIEQRVTARDLHNTKKRSLTEAGIDDSIAAARLRGTPEIPPK